MFSKILLVSCFTLTSAFASYETAEKSFGRGTVNKRTIVDLVNAGYYFSTVPWMKDFIVKSDRLDGEMEQVLDNMLYHTGLKPFESLPEDILKRSRSGNIRYILAKRLFKKGNNQAALNELDGISADHLAYPFVAHLKGTILSNNGNHQQAESVFKDCVNASERRMSKTNSITLKDQLTANKDYCLAGIARAQFSTESYGKAEVSYLDIQKESFVWPEILFEEAWTSYYTKNYNRTLGKLVSYKAPVFDFIFKPEVEVLKALTYMRMCLYDDAKKTADDFFGDLTNPAKDLRSFLLSRGKDYKYYYHLMSDHEEGKRAPTQLMENVLKAVRKEAAYIEMKSALTMAIAEYNQLKKRSNTSMNGSLVRNVRVLADEYRTLIGAYVRASAVTKYAEIHSAFQGMSYIKLEILAQRKEQLYRSSEVEAGKKRGDLKYIERNDKQYFWTFNGEFWADELGDYVFALRSEC